MYCLSFKLQTNLVNSASSSLSALNMSEEDYLEENFMDDSSVSSNMNPSQQLGDCKSWFCSRQHV